jgi:tetratricopeptide (TPR) repeat protein
MRNERGMTTRAGLLLVLATVAMTAGCQKPAGSTPLDTFLAASQKLPAPQRETMLRQVIRGGGRDWVFAQYALGNIYYDAASDSTKAVGAGGAAAMLDSARVHFEQAARDTEFVEAQVNLGSVYDDLADQPGGPSERATRLANAEAAYKRALARRPGDEKARCNLGALHVKRQQYAEAMTQFRQALADHPHSALAHYNLAILFADAKIYREAKAEWQAAAKADPRGDIGRRSRANVKIVEKMMSAPVPDNLGQRPPAQP